MFLPGLPVEDESSLADGNPVLTGFVVVVPGPSSDVEPPDDELSGSTQDPLRLPAPSANFSPLSQSSAGNAQWP